MKESYYFPHDYDPTSDPKIQALIGEFGAIGYGIYWRIVEMLHSDSLHKLPLKQYIYLAIAKQMLTSAEQTQAIINYCIDVCELFVSDGVFFYSNRVNSNFEKRSEISEKRRVAGRAGAIAKQNLAKCSKGKEKKEKENKESIEPIDLSFIEPEYKNAFETFLQYKKDRKESYKTKQTILAAYMNLKLLSDLNPENAVKVVNQTMANNWKGLFKLKEQVNTNQIKPKYDLVR
jgi:hypothetical protein